MRFSFFKITYFPVINESEKSYKTTLKNSITGLNWMALVPQGNFARVKGFINIQTTQKEKWNADRRQG